MKVVCENCGREHEIECRKLGWRCVCVDDTDSERVKYTHEAVWEGCCECNDYDMEVTFTTEETPEKKLIPEPAEFKGCHPVDPDANCVCPQPYDEDVEHSYWFQMHGMRVRD